MKILKIALAVTCAVASTAATANVVKRQKTPESAKVSTCYYVGSYITETEIYDFYDCYSNGDGSY
ncbi:MAG: hypothetical protein WC816_05750 [Sphingomonas sp.]|jgi:hypothetical protein